MGNLWEIDGTFMVYLWDIYGKSIGNLWEMGNLWETIRKIITRNDKRLNTELERSTMFDGMGKSTMQFCHLQ